MKRTVGMIVTMLPLLFGAPLAGAEDTSSDQEMEMAAASGTIVVFTFKNNRTQTFRLAQSQGNIRRIDFSGETVEPSPPTSFISVISAIYGANCGNPYSVERVARECNGKSRCSGPVGNDYAGKDPAPGCGKDFRVRYTCSGGPTKEAYVPAKLLEGGRWELSCP